jgi:hypothetical protein
MATLEIRRKTNKVWQHVSSDLGTYIVSKMYCKTNGNTFQIVESGGSKRGEYDFSDITIYDDVNSGGAETFASAELLMKRLEALNYVGFYYDGEVVAADLISTDPSNNITLGTDNKLFSSGGSVSTDWSDLTNFNLLTSATTPLAGTEEVAIVQGATTKKVAVSEFGGVTGSGTDNYVPKFNGTTAIENSIIYDNGINIGIGTTIPSSKLQVNGDLTVGDDATLGSFINIIAAGVGQDSGIRFGSESNTDLRAAIYTNTSNSNLHFDVTETTRMLINSVTGNVGIGTTSPSSKLEVNGTFNVNNIGDRVIIADPSAGTFSIGDLDAVGGESQIVGDSNTIKINNNGNTTLTASINNRIGIGTTSPLYPLHVNGQVSNISIYASNDIVAFSDQSVKNNIRPIENVIEKIQNSRGVIYDRTDCDSKNNIGFIAQELEVNFPELVVTNEDGTKAVKYQNTVAVLFEAVKEQQKQIEELKQIVNGFTK